MNKNKRISTTKNQKKEGWQTILFRKFRSQVAAFPGFMKKLLTDGVLGGAFPKTGSRKEKAKWVFLLLLRVVWVAAIIWFVVSFFRHPDYFTQDKDGNETTMFGNSRTWFMLGSALVLFILTFLPNKLGPRANRVFTWIAFAAAPFEIYAILFHLNSTRFHIVFANLDRLALVLTFVALYLVLLFLLLLTGSVRFSVSILAIVIAVAGIVNWYVVSFRGQAISGADIFSVDAAATVVQNYTFRVGWFVFSEAYLTFALILAVMKLRGEKLWHWKARACVCAAWLAVAGGYFHLCTGTSFLEDHDIRSGGFTHQLRYKQYDMIFTTLTTCFYLVVDQPEGYSVRHVREIAEPYLETELSAEVTEKSDDGQEAADSELYKENWIPSDEASETSVLPQTSGDQEKEFETPNLVVIMNESFADYMNIGAGLDLTGDNMPFIHSLTENTIKGNVYASIFGANTPNSEYEFLTGLTMGFLPPTSVGFNLFVRGDMPSLASELKDVGYETLAIHPYRGYNYRRNVVYPQIGFDRYLTRDDFTDPEYIRKYISDNALVDKIEQEYEKHMASSPDTPLFCYNVTIQNHGDYLSSSINNLDLTIGVQNKDINRTKAIIYANLIKESDEVFEKLINYFSERTEPVVIVMFGDHQANLGDSTYVHLLGKTEEELTPEERMEKFKIPFIVWANYDIEEEVIEKTSLNYLYSIISDRLNLPQTPFQSYLLDLQKEIPALAAGGYWAADGSFYELDDKQSPYYDLINDYNILEYNYIFGKKKRDLELFTLQSELETEEARTD